MFVVVNLLRVVVAVVLRLGVFGGVDMLVVLVVDVLVVGVPPPLVVLVVVLLPVVVGWTTLVVVGWALAGRSSHHGGHRALLVEVE